MDFFQRTSTNCSFHLLLWEPVSETILFLKVTGLKVMDLSGKLVVLEVYRLLECWADHVAESLFMCTCRHAHHSPGDKAGITKSDSIHVGPCFFFSFVRYPAPQLYLPHDRKHAGLGYAALYPLYPDLQLDTQIKIKSVFGINREARMPFLNADQPGWSTDFRLLWPKGAPFTRICDFNLEYSLNRGEEIWKTTW